MIEWVRVIMREGLCVCVYGGGGAQREFTREIDEYGTMRKITNLYKNQVCL